MFFKGITSSFEFLCHYTCSFIWTKYHLKFIDRYDFSIHILYAYYAINILSLTQIWMIKFFRLEATENGWALVLLLNLCKEWIRVWRLGRSIPLPDEFSSAWIWEHPWNTAWVKQSTCGIVSEKSAVCRCLSIKTRTNTAGNISAWSAEYPWIYRKFEVTQNTLILMNFLKIVGYTKYFAEKYCWINSPWVLQTIWWPQFQIQEHYSANHH